MVAIAYCLTIHPFLTFTHVDTASIRYRHFAAAQRILLGHSFFIEVTHYLACYFNSVIYKTKKDVLYPFENINMQSKALARLLR
ncbi:hypothetical protein NNRS527_01529 [Nitrosospira sp. NRS527]|nr:hypothetical protein NNRS527_01529 [Nitrosospira sp. NRS527]